MLSAPETTAQPEAAAFRLALPVTRILLFPSGDSYPICPRCGRSLDREYLNYCNSCGQHLSWKKFGTAKIQYWRSVAE